MNHGFLIISLIILFCGSQHQAEADTSSKKLRKTPGKAQFKNTPQVEATRILQLGTPKNLDACFEAALKRSEDVATQTQLIVQVEERYRQAIGSILPNVSAVGSYLVQQGSASSIYPSSQPLAKITANQPLFQGFREFAALRQTQSIIASQRYLKWQATVQLYQDVTQNFYSLLSMEKDAKNIQRQLGLYRQRISELNQFVKLGRSRPSEVLTVETQMQTLSAQADQVEFQIQATRDVFRFLTGLPRDTALIDEENMPESFADLSRYLDLVTQRPDVKSAQQNIQTADEGIKLAEGNHLPNLSLLGNYYLYRYGIQQNVNWDAQVNLTLPLFAGGVIQSGVRLAESQKSQNELALSKTQRLAEQQIATFYHTLRGDQTQVSNYKKLTQLAQRNYETELQDYKHGLVNNIDVLQALISYQDSQRILDRSIFLVKSDYARIEAGVAQRPKYVPELGEEHPL